MPSSFFIHTFIKERIFQCASSFLDDLDSWKISRTLKPQHCIHSQLGEVLFVLWQYLGAQSGTGNVKEIFMKLCNISTTREQSTTEHKVLRKVKDHFLTKCQPIAVRSQFNLIRFHKFFGFVVKMSDAIIV